MSEQDLFAFGENRVDGVCCPAKAAGFSVSGTVARVATQYDTYAKMAVYGAFKPDDAPGVEEIYNQHGPLEHYLSDHFGVRDGVLDAEEARKQFKRAAEAQNAPEVYEAVAAELGWE